MTIAHTVASGGRRPSPPLAGPAAERSLGPPASRVGVSEACARGPGARARLAGVEQARALPRGVCRPRRRRRRASRAV